MLWQVNACVIDNILFKCKFFGIVSVCVLLKHPSRPEPLINLMHQFVFPAPCNHIWKHNTVKQHQLHVWSWSGVIHTAGAKVSAVFQHIAYLFLTSVVWVVLFLVQQVPLVTTASITTLRLAFTHTDVNTSMTGKPA